MLKPKFIILMAAYNGSKFIYEQILSILNQTDVDVKLIIGLDISVDNTLELIKNFDTRVFVIENGTLPNGAAINFFNLIAKVDFKDYDYVGLADQDDIWFPDKLFRSHLALSAQPNEAYSSSIEAFWSDGKRLPIKKSSIKDFDYVFESGGPGCTYVLKPNLAAALKKCISKNFNSLSRVDHHDWFIYFFARANGYQWYIDPKPTLLYRQHDNNSIGANAGLKAFIYRSRLVLSGYGFSQAIIISEIVSIEKCTLIVGLLYKRFGYLKLAFNCFKFRRKFIDCIFFFITCMIFYIFRLQNRINKFYKVAL